MTSGGRTRRRSVVLPLAAVVLAAVAIAPLILSAFSGRTSNAGSAFAAAGLFPPRATSPPTITGTPTEGSQLTATTGTWARSPTTTTLRWQRCDQSGTPTSCADLAGATSTTYTPIAADVGHKLRVVATATNAAGTTTAASSPTAQVAPKPAPVNTTPPSISGTAMVGRTLQADDGRWNPSTVSLTRRWQRCDQQGNGCVDISAATGTTYFPTTTDTGATLRVRVTAADGSLTTSASSAATGTVAAAPPVTNSPPAVSGMAQHGVTLTSTEGTWTSQVSFTTGRQWLRCDQTGGSCTAIAGATASTYTPTATDVGATLRLRVTATNATAGGAAATADSPPTATVARSYENEVLADSPTNFLRLKGNATATRGPNGATTGTISWVAGAIATDPGDKALGVCLNPCSGFTHGSVDDATFRGATTVELWFQCLQGTAGALLSQLYPAPFAAPSTWFVPALYVGYDSHLYAGWWDGQTIQVVSAVGVMEGRWHHAVFTRTSGSVTLYVDGQLVGTKTGGPWATAPAGAVTVLGNGWTNPSWPQSRANWYFDFQGAIDEVSLYDHALSAARVSAHWQASGR
jgi:hypothetical protein